MTVSEIDISDYVSGRLDDDDQRRMEFAIASNSHLRNAVAKAQAVDCTIKMRFYQTRR